MSAFNKTLHPDEKLKADKLGGKLFRLGALAGVVLLVLGVILGASVDQGAKWQRFFYAYLVAWGFVCSISIGSLFFIISHHLARAKWGIVLRRLAEFITGAFPLLFVLGLGIVIPVLAGYKSLYFWTEHGLHSDTHPLHHHMHNKLSWFDPYFFAGRYVLYFAVYIGISRWFAAKSRAQDTATLEEAAVLHEKMRIWSGIAALVYALTTVFFAFDMFMSLAPTWFSTIYSVNWFAGAMLATYCTFALLARAIQRSGRMVHSVTTEHYHDIGKYMFGWTFFWIYTAFSQFMLQWYGNMPEETIFYNYRMFSQWEWVSWALLLGHWALPYVALVTRWTKRILPILMALAVWQLAFHYVDLYWNVMPNQQWTHVCTTPDGLVTAFTCPATTLVDNAGHLRDLVLGPLQGDPGLHRVNFHAVDLVLLFAMIALFLAAVGRSMRGNLVPIKDPKLGASLAFENY
jgi:hypothetical protein